MLTSRNYITKEIKQAWRKLRLEKNDQEVADQKPVVKRNNVFGKITRKLWHSS